MDLFAFCILHRVSSHFTLASSTLPCITMKLLAAALSSLLVSTTHAFTPIAVGRPIYTACRSYLDNLEVAEEMLDNHGYMKPSTSYGKSSASWLDSSRREASTTAAASTPSTTTTISQLNLEVADALASGAVAVAKRNNFPPIVVTVVDRQANTLVQKRMDNVVHVAFPEFSYAKAYPCATLGVSSREFRDKYTTENDASKIGQMNSMMAISGKMAAFPGGVLLRNGENEIVGAVGVSGAAGDEDEYVALMSVWESGLGLHTQPKEHSCTTMSD